MYLPETVLELMKRLRSAGYESWAVGGCVRDSLLGITPHDYDLCTNAAPAQMERVFAGRELVLAGVKHGTVGVVTDMGVVEITTYRTEGDYSDSRHPGWVRFVPTVQEDLARRDFTVNAMAYAPDRGLVDPFGGADDLRRGLLRAVGIPAHRFGEDALRILRGLRFAARFGLRIEDHTWAAMNSESGGLEHLAPERVFAELTGFLTVCDAKSLLMAQDILARVIPELKDTLGFCQHSPHHAYDVFTHIAYVTGAVEPEPELRFAALLHDVGKPPCFTRDETGRGHFYGHADRGAQMAEEILTRLKAPTAFREEVVWLIGHHMFDPVPEPGVARRALSRHGYDRMRRLMALELADLSGKGVVEEEDGAERIRRFAQLLDQLQQQEGRFTLKDLAVDGRDLMDLGYAPGRELGNALNTLLEQVLAEKLPNEKQALLTAAKRWL